MYYFLFLLHVLASDFLCKFALLRCFLAATSDLHPNFVVQNFILDVEGYPSSVINLFVVIGLFILRFTSPNLP